MMIGISNNFTYLEVESWIQVVGKRDLILMILVFFVWLHDTQVPNSPRNKGFLQFRSSKRSLSAGSISSTSRS